MESLKRFEVFALTKGYEAAMHQDKLLLNNVTNEGNNFSIQKIEDYYAVITVQVSKADFEYTAKCEVYLLLAEFNKLNSEASHNHINFKVDL